MSLTAALQQGAGALGVFSTGLSVAGNNLANAGTPGYARESLRVETGYPYRQGGQIVGGGVRAAGVRQHVDAFLEGRLHAANGEAAAAGAAADLFAGLERVLNELSDSDLSTALSDFAAAVGRVTAEPTNAALRSALVDGGAALARDFQTLSARAHELTDGVADRAAGLAEEANGLIEEVHTLNRQIVRLELGGHSESQAGPLRDARYRAMGRLSEIVPLDAHELPTGAVELRSGSDWLVLGDSVQTLELATNPENPAGPPALLTSRTRSALAGGGELGGLLGAAERVVGGFLEDLDNVAAGLIETVNRVHADGRGMSPLTSVTSQGPVAEPLLALNDPANVGRFGLPFAPEHGAFTFTVVHAGTGAETATRIDVDLDGLGGPDTTPADLAAALDAVDGVTAGFDSRGRLEITADAGRSFAFADDSSGALAALGVNAFFAGRDADSIAVDPALAADPGRLAVGRGGGPADNSNIHALGEAFAAPVAGSTAGAFAGRSVQGLWGETVAAVSRGAAEETAFAEGAALHRDALVGQRERFSGVSLDEEAVRIMELQRQYQASARVISAADELLGVLINL